MSNTPPSTSWILSREGFAQHAITLFKGRAGGHDIQLFVEDDERHLQGFDRRFGIVPSPPALRWRA